MDLEQEISRKEIEQDRLSREMQEVRTLLVQQHRALESLKEQLSSEREHASEQLQAARQASEHLQEEQDAFLALLLDEHEQELTRLREERDDALAQSAMAEHTRRRVSVEQDSRRASIGCARSVMKPDVKPTTRDAKPMQHGTKSTKPSATSTKPSAKPTGPSAMRARPNRSAARRSGVRRQLNNAWKTPKALWTRRVASWSKCAENSSPSSESSQRRGSASRRRSPKLRTPDGSAIDLMSNAIAQSKRSSDCAI
ncbi:MAG: hypothetical protein R3B07_23625 [Polyangiaceae bacterium]